MADDLYEVLGVEKTADSGAIRKAYRRKAKKAHPDAGGSHDEMARLSRAMTVLVDPVAREHYDRTGDEEKPDREKMVADVLIGCVLAVLDGLRARNNDPCSFDLVAIARSSMLDKRREIEAMARHQREEAAHFEKVANRFKGADVIKKALLDRAKAAEKTAAMNEDHVKVVAEAMKRLSTASFDFEATSYSINPGPGGIVFTSGGGGTTWR